jgi:hypothetical protein
MAIRKPLVMVAGAKQELSAADVLPLAAIPTGTTSAAVALGSAASNITNLRGRQAGSGLSSGTTGALVISGTAYFVYVGRTTQAFTPFVNFFVSTLGAGAQTAAVGLFSTPAPPNRAAQTLTCLSFSATLTALTSTGMKRNTTALSAVANEVNLWAGVRIAMATTQPQIGPWLQNDFGQGTVLTTAGAAVFSNGATYAGALVTAALATNAVPSMFLSLD